MDSFINVNYVIYSKSSELPNNSLNNNRRNFVDETDSVIQTISISYQRYNEPR